LLSAILKSLFDHRTVKVDLTGDVFFLSIPVSEKLTTKIYEDKKSLAPKKNSTFNQQRERLVSIGFAKIGPGMQLHAQLRASARLTLPSFMLSALAHVFPVTIKCVINNRRGNEK
jgi:hypothetical protein